MTLGAQIFLKAKSKSTKEIYFILFANFVGSYDKSLSNLQFLISLTNLLDLRYLVFIGSPKEQ